MATSTPKQRPPILARELPRADLKSLDDADVEQACLDAVSLARGRADRVRFEGVRLVGGQLSESHVTALRWVDVECERTDLSMTEWPGAQLTRVTFRDCLATGAKWAGCAIEDVRFIGCKLEYASLAAARLRRVSFEQCRLREADFSGADLAGTSFAECDLRGVDLVGAKLAGAQVWSSTMQEVRVEARDVRGLVVSREQAAALAQLFGIVVRDA
jgi:uncharacterized protein YjbI with pentapeptide repeats